MLRNLKDACFYAVVVRGTRMFWMMWYIRKTAQSAYLNKIVVVVQSLSPVLHFVTPWTAARQASLSFTISWSLLKLISIESVMPANYLVLCHPLLLCLQTFPASESFPVSQLFTSSGQSIGLSASASVLPVNSQGWVPLVWSAGFPRYSQESSLASQVESINSSALSLLNGPTVISVLDYWRNHSFDYTDLCWLLGWS